MNKIHEELKSMLQELIPCIVGDWFVGDGALLGIIRDNNLIEGDDDIDIYLCENSYIDLDKLNKTSLKNTSYYLNDKIYREKNPIDIKNPWIEYIDYQRALGNLKNMNRGQILNYCSMNYKTEKKEIKHTTPNIDVFYLNKVSDVYKYKKGWDFLFFNENELYPLQDDNTLGFNVKIPKKYKEILERQYNTDYNNKNPNFKYF